MKITSVRIRKIAREGSRMRGVASITVDNAIAIHDIRIIDGNDGLYIAMPSRRTPIGNFKDIVHPINPEVREMFEKTILDAYNNTNEFGYYDEE